MSESETGLLNRIENTFPIALGIGELLIGLMLIVLTALFPTVNPLFAKLGADLGVGLLAAGIVTATLEPISRRRLQGDISEIKRAHFEAILTGVMPAPIYEEIQAHIIRQPFLRQNVSIMYDLEWADSDRKVILRKQTTYYEVTNLSKTVESFTVRILEEKDLGVTLPELPRITEMRIMQNDRDEILLAESELAGIQTSTLEHVEASYSVQLKPGEMIRVWLKSQSALANRVDTIVMLVPTVNLDLIVSHSEDMEVRAYPLHPSFESFEISPEMSKLKKWCILGGILPYQGLQLFWGPKALTSQGNDKP